MTELDTLLADDARRCEAADGPAADFAPAFDRALGTTRRRRARTLGVSALAVAAIATGSALAVNLGADPQQPQQPQLAAYDKVLGSVPHDDGALYVVGPQDEHTAHCTVVPGMTVTVQPPGGPDEGLAVGIKLLPGMTPKNTTPANTPFLHFSKDVLGRGQLYVFTCPKS